MLMGRRKLHMDPDVDPESLHVLGERIVVGVGEQYAITVRYLALLIKTREQSVPRAENANRPALKGSPSNMAEMAVRRLEENAVRRHRLELVEPVVAVFCR